MNHSVFVRSTGHFFLCLLTSETPLRCWGSVYRRPPNHSVCSGLRLRDEAGHCSHTSGRLACLGWAVTMISTLKESLLQTPLEQGLWVQLDELKGGSGRDCAMWSFGRVSSGPWGNLLFLPLCLWVSGEELGWDHKFVKLPSKQYVTLI